MIYTQKTVLFTRLGLFFFAFVGISTFYIHRSSFNVKAAAPTNISARQLYFSGFKSNSAIRREAEVDGKNYARDSGFDAASEIEGVIL